MYLIRGSHLCAAIVQFYCTYYLYYLVLCVSSDLCALYLYYFPSLTQKLRILAALTQLVPATTAHSPPPLKSQWWRSCSGANGGAPVSAGANVGPSHQHPIHSIRPICPIHPVTSQLIKASISWSIRYDTIQSSRYNTIQPTIGYNPANDTILSSVYSDQKDPINTHPQLPHCLSIHILYHISCWSPLIWFFTLSSGLCHQTFALFLWCCIFCCLICFGFR